MPSTLHLFNKDSSTHNEHIHAGKTKDYPALDSFLKGGGGG